MKKIGSLDKGADGVVSVGDEITYTFKVINTSNVPLQNVVITDEKLGITENVGNLPLDDTNTTDVKENEKVIVSTTKYAITQEDIDAGKVENTAVVNAEDADGHKVSDDSDSDNPADNDDNGANTNNTTDSKGHDGKDDNDPTVTLLDQDASLKLEKTSTIDEDATAGHIIKYTFVVTNTGKVTLTNLQLADDNKNVKNITLGSTVLAPGKTSVGTAIYV